MTACVNRKHSKKVAAVVTASLVGALSLGVAPVAAMANEGVDMLTGTTVDNLAGGSITEYTDQDTDECGLEFAYDGKAHYIVPTKIQPEVGSAFDIDADSATDGYKVCYYKIVDAMVKAEDKTPDGDWLQYLGRIDGKDFDASKFIGEGSYVVVVMKEDATTPLQGVQLEWKVVGNNLDNARVVRSDDHDSSEFVYDGNGIVADTDWVIMLGETQLTMNAGGGLSSFQVYKDGQPVLNNAPVDEGDYTIRIIGADQYAGQDAEIPFKISAIDLASTDIEYGNGVKEYSTGNVLPNFASKIGDLSFVEVVSQGIVNGKSAYRASAGINKTTRLFANLEFVAAESTEAIPSGKAGRYVYKLTVANEDGSECTNVTGERIITVVRYAKDAVMKYDGGADINGSTDTATHFNADYMDVRTTAGKKLAYTVSYYEESAPGKGDWKPVDASATQYPGSYKAEFVVDDNTFEWGGRATVTFQVGAIDIANADAYITYKGEVFDDGDTVDVYTGEDLLANLGIKAFDEDRNEVPASEFDLKVTKKGSDEAVTELVDAGDYVATIVEKDDSMYRVDGNKTFSFTVAPVKILGTYNKLEKDESDNAVARFVGTLTYGADKDQTYAWTGKAIVPTFEYDVEWGEYADTEDWKALPTDAYKVEFTKKGSTKVIDECVDPGWYTMHVTDSAKDGNHVIEFDVNFQISNDRVFLDVTNDKWFSEYVYTAAANGWMTGFDGTNLFGPDQDIKRGDVAVVLWKMAGKPNFSNNENWYTEDGGWKTGFGDVDGNKYYAQAIAWAKAAGLVTGDTGTGMFRPDATISRQELAAMLARYAAKCGEDTAVDADAILGEYEDASTVSEWAEGDVAYLVSTGVMGSDSPLRGADPITRAEVATMVVRLDDVFDFDLMPIVPDNPNWRPQA